MRCIKAGWEQTGGRAYSRACVWPVPDGYLWGSLCLPHMCSCDVLICVLVGGLMLVLTICFTPVATPTQMPLLLPQAIVKIASNLHSMSIYAHAGR